MRRTQQRLRVMDIRHQALALFLGLWSRPPWERLAGGGLGNCLVGESLLGFGNIFFSFITCSRHRNLQNIWIPILQIFCFDFFAWSKVGRIALIFLSNAPQNQNKDLENWNSNILEVPMSRTGYYSSGLGLHLSHPCAIRTSSCLASVKVFSINSFTTTISCLALDNVFSIISLTIDFPVSTCQGLSQLLPPVVLPPIHLGPFGSFPPFFGSLHGLGPGGFCAILSLFLCPSFLSRWVISLGSLSCRFLHLPFSVLLRQSVLFQRRLLRSV